jgi:putative ABC transport system permease protein
MQPAPVAVLVWLLRLVSSRDEAASITGDFLEELTERTRAGLAPPLPRLWVNLQTIRAIVLTIVAAVPRVSRSAGLILRDSVRALRAAPASSLFVILVLAIGVTVGTITFSVVDAVVLRPLPVEQPEQLVTIPSGDMVPAFTAHVTPEKFWLLREHLASVEYLTSRFTLSGETLTVRGIREQQPLYQAGADIFPMLRWSAAIGRLWTREDEDNGVTDVAVLGHRFWREKLGSDPSILGETVSLGEGGRYRVIGVLAASSDRDGFDLTTGAIWVPFVVPRSGEGRVGGLLARMRPGVTPAQVADDVQRLVGSPGWKPEVKPLLDQYTARFSDWMLLALGAAVMVVLIACANAANLMLTRSAGRARELAIRASLGASRRQIASAVLTEGLLLSCGATICALLFSLAGVRLAKVAIETMLPGTFRATTIALDTRVLAVALAAAVITGVLVSFVPAWQTSRAPVSSLLKDAEGATSTGRRRWRSVFLTAEVAIVTVLLVVSWLFVVSLIRMVGTDLGIDRTNLLAIQTRYEFRATADEVEERLRILPGVAGVARSTAASLPLIGRAYGGAWHDTTLERADGGSPGGTNSAVKALQYRVTPNFFDVAGIAFRRGATWPAETEREMPPVVLDEHVARQLFGDQDPIGRLVRASAPKGVFTVTGTVARVYARGAEEQNLPSAYFASLPSPTRNFAGFFVKTTRPADEMVPLVNEALMSVMPTALEPFVHVADSAVQRITAVRRFNGGLMALFGLVGVIIGAAGVYAVMAAFVAQQTREIGVRMALGATPSRIQRGIMTLAWRHLAAGLAIGVPAAWWLSRGFASLLFQVTPADASVYAGVAALLCGVGVMAAWVPARRASRVDPIVSLRT